MVVLSTVSAVSPISILKILYRDWRRELLDVC